MVFKTKICAIDTETTGLIPYYNEIVSLAVVPLNDNYDIDETIEPFNILMKPDNPVRWSSMADSVNNLKNISESTGVDSDTAKSLFGKWVNKLNVDKISPVAQNWPFDKNMVDYWLGLGSDGTNLFDKYFDRRHRDLQVIAIFIDDLLKIKGEKPMFSYYNLTRICQCFNIELNAHDALNDAIATAKCYKKCMDLFKNEGGSLCMK